MLAFMRPGTISRAKSRAAMEKVPANNDGVFGPFIVGGSNIVVILFASRHRLFWRIPEGLVAALAHTLHSGADIHEQHDVLGVARPHRLRAESLQCPGKGIKTLAILLHQ